MINKKTEALMEKITKAHDIIDDLLKRILNCKDDIEDLSVIAQALLKRELKNSKKALEEIGNIFYFHDFDFGMFDAISGYINLYEDVLMQITDIIILFEEASFITQADKAIFEAKKKLHRAKHELAINMLNLRLTGKNRKRLYDPDLEEGD